MTSTNSLDDRVRGLLANTALAQRSILATVLAHPNVAAFAPRRAPRIFYLPVLNAILGAIAYGQNSVVQSSTTCRRENPSTVQLEVPVGFNGYSHRARVDSILQVGLTAADICVAADRIHVRSTSRS